MEYPFPYNLLHMLQTSLCLVKFALLACRISPYHLYTIRAGLSTGANHSLNNSHPTGRTENVQPLLKSKTTIRCRCVHLIKPTGKRFDIDQLSKESMIARILYIDAQQKACQEKSYVKCRESSRKGIYKSMNNRENNTYNVCINITCLWHIYTMPNV